MSRSDFFEKAMNDLDEKYINEAAEELYKRQGAEIIVNDNRTAKPQKNSGIKMFLGIAAAAALVIGSFAVLDRIDDNKPVIDKNPSGNQITDKVTKYDCMVLWNEDGWRTEIYRDIYDENSVLMVELIEKLENLNLKETRYIPTSNGDVDFVSIDLRCGSDSDFYVLTHCYASGTLEKRIVEKNGVYYEAVGDDFIRVMELSAELMKSAVPTLMTGEYYLDGNDESGVYIEVKNGTICLMGDKALDFVKENYDGEDTSYTAPYDLYNALGEKQFVVSSIYENPLKMPIITEWDKNKNVNANRYEGTSYYYYAGEVSNGSVIELLGNYFYFSPIENIEYKEEFERGKIEFTRLIPIDYSSDNQANLPVDELKGKDAFVTLTCGNEGIYRFGETVLSDYKFSESKSWESSMKDSVVPSDCIFFSYGKSEERKSSSINIFAGQVGSFPPALLMSNGMALGFPELNNEAERVSVLALGDGSALELKIGGAVYNGTEYYYVAEWTDERYNIKYRVTGKNCERWDFINSVIALIYDVDGIGNLASLSGDVIPVNFDVYKWDFQIFYDYFRAIWWNNETGYDVKLDWHDNMFSYNEPLAGFYKDGKGAYMARKNIEGYVVFFIPEHDRNSMYQYFAQDSGDGTYIVGEVPGTVYTKKKEARYIQYTGLFGYIGLMELCETTGLDFDLLHELSITDHNGTHWERSFNAGWLNCEAAVINYGYKEDGPVVMALEFINSSDGETRQYFVCTFEKDRNGEYKLSDFPNEPYKVDISEFDLYTSQTKNAISLQEAEKSAFENGISAYYPNAEYHIYRVSNEAYYLVRQMGMNQAQWKSYIDIFYYNGTEYIHADNDYEAIMGMFYTCVKDGYMYYLGEYENSEFYLSCIYEGREISRYDAGYLNCPGFLSMGCDDNMRASFVFSPLNSDAEWEYTVDFSDPYNPRFVHMINRSNPGDSSGLYGDYRFAEDLGEKLNNEDYSVSDDARIMSDMYMIKASEAEKLLLKPFHTVVIAMEDGKGYNYTEGSGDWWFTYISDEITKHIEVGYILDGIAHPLESGQNDFQYRDYFMTGYPEGEYYMYITNYSGYLQYYDFIGISSMQSLQEERSRIPNNDYRFADEAGEKLEKPGYNTDDIEGKPILGGELFLIEARDAEKLVLMPGQTIVFTIDKDRAYRHSGSTSDTAWFSFMLEELSWGSVGAMSDEKIYSIYNGVFYETDNDFILGDNLPEGEYRFFITNMTGHLQYFKFIGLGVT